MSSYEILLEQLQHYRRVPRMLSELELCDEDGWTLAHEAAVKGCLPSDYSNWELADHSGYTVAHAKASTDSHPVDFPYWHLKNKCGKTVAEVAVEAGTLPWNYPSWEEVTSQGETLAHIAARTGKLPSRIIDSKRIMMLKNKEGVTVEKLLKERNSRNVQKCLEILHRKTGV